MGLFIAIRNRKILSLRRRILNPKSKLLISGPVASMNRARSLRRNWGHPITSPPRSWRGTMMRSATFGLLASLCTYCCVVTRLLMDPMTRLFSRKFWKASFRSPMKTGNAFPRKPRTRLKKCSPMTLLRDRVFRTVLITLGTKKKRFVKKQLVRTIRFWTIWKTSEQTTSSKKRYSYTSFHFSISKTKRMNFWRPSNPRISTTTANWPQRNS